MLLQRDERYFETLTELFLFFPGNIIGGIPPRQKKAACGLTHKKSAFNFFLKALLAFLFLGKKKGEGEAAPTSDPVRSQDKKGGRESPAGLLLLLSPQHPFPLGPSQKV